MTSSTPTSVTVTFWPQNGVRIYTVSYRLNGLPGFFRTKSEPVTSSGLTTVVVTGLQCGREYEFWGWSFGDGTTTAGNFNDPPPAGPRLATPACAPTPDRPGAVTLSDTTPQVGTAVTATLTDPDRGIANLTWQWQRLVNSRWQAISSAAAAAYTPATADVGYRLRAIASYTDGHGPGKRATSAQTTAVAAAPTPDQRGTITLSNTTPQVGTAVTATLTDPDRGITNLTWQWQRLVTGWGDIAGARSSSYTPVSADVGYRLRAIASYTDGHGPGKSATSAQTTAVAAAPPPALTPPDAPTGLTATATGPTAVDLKWDSQSGVAKYEVQRREGAAGPWVTESSNVQGAGYTVTGLTPNTAYFFSVRAYGNGTDYAADWSPPSLLAPATTSGPVIEVARGVGTSPTIDEGAFADFVIVADPAPIADLTIDVAVDLVGTFFSGQVPTSVTIDAGTQLASIHVQTVDDKVDEANGEVTVTVGASGSGAYSLGMTSAVSVTIRDDDLPLIPANLRANGHVQNGAITVRWDPVSTATHYSVRYALERCTLHTVTKIIMGEPTEVSELRCQAGMWRAPMASSTTETTINGLAKEFAYRIQVRAHNAEMEVADWSEKDFALVFPTDGTFGGAKRVLSAPFHGYLDKNEQGSHEFLYVVCENTLPARLDMDVDDMEMAIKTWEETVVWDKGGYNIITTTPTTLPMGEQCSTDDDYIPHEGRFEVKFATNEDIRRACTPLRISGDGPPACWRSRSWELPTLNQITSGTVLVNAGKGIAHWNTPVSVECRRLHETLIHEVGHAFGIGTRDFLDFNEHPINHMHSVMSYRDGDSHCQPQAYDILAVMALYQSR